MNGIDHERSFEYENGYMLTAPIERFSKFVTHLDLYRMISGIAGEVVECGVFRGNSLFRFIKFRALLENPQSRRIIGFDTFGAFPEERHPMEQERIELFMEQTSGGRSHSREAMLEHLQRTDLAQNVQLVEGDLNDTLPSYLTAHSHLRIALLHVDVDLYQPTRLILETLYPHVVRGGVVILDDYGTMPGASRAIEEFFADDADMRIQKLPHAHGISFVVKP